MNSRCLFTYFSISFCENDGGDIELVKFEDGIAYIKFMGACADCGLQNVTLNDGIKEFLVNEIDEVIDVKLI